MDAVSIAGSGSVGGTSDDVMLRLETELNSIEQVNFIPFHLFENQSTRDH